MGWAGNRCSGSGRILCLKQKSSVLKIDAEGRFRSVFFKKADFQSLCALNTANSIIDLHGEKRKLNNDFCLTKFLWGVLKYNQSGFALVLPQILTIIYCNWRNGGNKRGFPGKSVFGKMVLGFLFVWVFCLVGFWGFFLCAGKTSYTSWNNGDGGQNIYQTIVLIAKI